MQFSGRWILGKNRRFHRADSPLFFYLFIIRYEGAIVQKVGLSGAGVCGIMR